MKLSFTDAGRAHFLIIQKNDYGREVVCGAAKTEKPRPASELPPGTRATACAVQNSEA